jgi:hypothetical protein
MLLSRSHIRFFQVSNFDGLLVRLLKKKKKKVRSGSLPYLWSGGLVFRSHLFLLGRHFWPAPIQLGPLSIPKVNYQTMRLIKPNQIDLLENFFYN